jgi:regulator of sigma E protease
MTTVIAFLVTLGVLIIVHEWGHYRVARACGVKVLRFSVGFGRVVMRRQRTPDSTEFVLSALPLGGYVRMLDEREGPVAPHERALAFNNKPLAQRAAIVAAGPAANLVLAVLLYAGSHWIGVDEPKAVLGAPVAASLAEHAGLRAGDWVRATSSDGQDWDELRSLPELRWQVTQATLRGEPLRLMVSDADGRGSRTLVLPLDTLGANDVDAALIRRIGIGAPFREAVMGEIVPEGPAARAGLKAGDRVLRVDGQTITDAAALLERIRASARDAQAAIMRWHTDGAERIGRIDAYVGRPPEMVTVRYGAVDGLVQGASRTWEVSSLTVKMLGRMLIGEASLKNLSGPLTIADYAGQSAQQGLAYYLGFLALVSVSLGVLNLLPLPMLDGGHLMYYIFEAVTGRPVSDWWLKWLQRGGALIMLLLMSLALSNDVARLLGLH